MTRTGWKRNQRGSCRGPQPGTASGMPPSEAAGRPFREPCGVLARRDPSNARSLLGSVKTADEIPDDGPTRNGNACTTSFPTSRHRPAKSSQRRWPYRFHRLPAVNCLPRPVTWLDAGSNSARRDAIRRDWIFSTTPKWTAK